MKLFEKLKKLLYPENLKCIVCNKEIFTEDAFSLCSECLTTLPFINDKICKICGEPIYGEGYLCERCCNNEITNIKLARAVFVYKGNIRKLIYKLKYENQKYIAKVLSELLHNYFVHSEDFKDIDVIIPVPLHKNKLKSRGYNQSELLLQKFNKDIVNINCLERVVDTPTQTKLDRKERLNNLENAFVVKNSEIIKNKNILIVDDIFTTGATCCSIAKILIKNKAKSVKCLTLCHTEKSKK